MKKLILTAILTLISGLTQLNAAETDSRNLIGEYTPSFKCWDVECEVVKIEKSGIIAGGLSIKFGNDGAEGEIGKDFKFDVATFGECDDPGCHFIMQIFGQINRNANGEIEINAVAIRSFPNPEDENDAPLEELTDWKFEKRNR